MKKMLIAVIVVVALMLALAVPAFAAPGNGQGAVKVGMVIHTDSGTEEMPAGTPVGSAILNTTASGCLILVVNLDDAQPIADNEATEDVDEGIYDLRIRVNGVIVDVVDCLKVNANGQGTANVKVDLLAVDGQGNPVIPIAEDDTEIEVSIVVRPSFVPSTTTPCYVNGPEWQTLIAVPLK